MEQGLQGKVAIVTGSASGIGASVARGLARRGADVVVNYSRNETDAKAVADQITEAGGRALCIQADVAADADCHKLADAALRAWGRIDILVNNAGTTKFAAHTDLAALSAQDWQMIYGVNVIGPFQMMRACVDALKARATARGECVIGRGRDGRRFVNRLRRVERRAQYADAFAGARFCAGDSRECRVSRLCRDALVQRAFRRGKRQPHRRATGRGQPAETRRLMQTTSPIAVLFLAGPELRNITGEFLLIDSGMHLNMTGTKR